VPGYWNPGSGMAAELADDIFFKARAVGVLNLPAFTGTRAWRLANHRTKLCINFNNLCAMRFASGAVRQQSTMASAGFRDQQAFHAFLGISPLRRRTMTNRITAPTTASTTAGMSPSPMLMPSRHEKTADHRTDGPDDDVAN
jgi:hypothetical protein